jgi:hypothetical protein
MPSSETAERAGADRALSFLLTRMTAAQIVEGQRRAATWQPR